MSRTCSIFEQNNSVRFNGRCRNFITMTEWPAYYTWTWRILVYPPILCFTTYLPYSCCTQRSHDQWCVGPCAGANILSNSEYCFEKSSSSRDIPHFINFTVIKLWFVQYQLSNAPFSTISPRYWSVFSRQTCGNNWKLLISEITELNGGCTNAINPSPRPSRQEH